MNIGSLPELILSWLKNQGLELPPAGQEPGLAQFKPGEQYEGKVLDALPNGRNLVQVGNQAMDMALPSQAKPGEVIRLTFLNLSPRPTFALNAPLPASNAQPVTVSQAAQQVSALVRFIPVTPSAPVPGASAVVNANVPSTAGPTASAVPSAATTPTTTAMPAVHTTNNVPPAGPPAQLAAAVATSTRPIVTNPAVLLAPAPATSAPMSVLPGPAIPAMTLAGEAVDGMRAALGSQSSLATAQGVVAEKAGASQVLPMRLQQTVRESGLFYESHLGKWARGEVSLDSIQHEPQARLLQSPGPLLDLPDLEGMPEQAARLASRQLHMLDGGPFIWQGQAWPGQTAEWQVQERAARTADDEAAGQRWSSQLRLTLPRLGPLSADLDVGALGLRVRLKAATPETLAAMQAALPELTQRLRDADLNLSSIHLELADAGQ